MAKNTTDLDNASLYEGEGFALHTNKWTEETNDGEETPKVYGRWTDPFAEEGGETQPEDNGPKESEPLTSSVVTSVEGSDEDAYKDETDESGDTDEPTTDNPIFFMARQAIADGFIDLEEGEEIPEDVDLGFVYSKYVESIRPKAEQAILQEVNSRLQNAGIKDEHIPILQAIENGVPVEDLYVVSRLQKYATADPDQIDDSKKMEIIKEWYQDRGLNEKEVRRQLEAIELNDEVDSELKDAQKFFADTVDSFAQEQRNYALQEQQATEELQRRNLYLVNQVIETKEVLGEKFTDTQVKELKNYIFQKDRLLNIDGQQLPVSAYEEFMYRVNNDLAYALRAFKRDTFRDKDLAVMKEIAQEEANKDFISAYKKVQEKSGSKSSVKRDDSTESTKDQYGRIIKKTSTGGTIMEFGSTS
jgi:hypothetical protein